MPLYCFCFISNRHPVNGDGTPLPPSKGTLLESVESTLTQPFGEDHTTFFSLKALQTSEGNKFRLLFKVAYAVEGNESQLIEEKVITRAFSVYSNKHNRTRKPSQKSGNNNILFMDIYLYLCIDTRSSFKYL